MTNFRRFGCTMMAACVLAVAAGGSAQAGKPAPAPKPSPNFRYDYVDLGLLAGGTFTWATAINDSCSVIGRGNRSANQYGLSVVPFLWSPLDGMHDLNSLIDPSLRCFMNAAADINNAGQICGSGKFDEDGDGQLDGPRRVLLFTPDDNDADLYGSIEAIDLSAVGGVEGTAVAINASGDIAGEFADGNSVRHVFLRTAEDGLLDLGPGIVRDLSDRDATGKVTLVGDFGNQAVGWKATFVPGTNAPTPAMQSLGVLYSDSRTPAASSAVAVNTAGQIVGWTSASRENYFAARHTDATGWVSLGTLASTKSSANDSEASAVNDSGYTLGRSLMGDTGGSTLIHGGTEAHPFIHSDIFGMWDLSLLVDEAPSSVADILGTPTGINESKDICGPSGVGTANRAYLLLAKPAP